MRKLSKKEPGVPPVCLQMPESLRGGHRPSYYPFTLSKLPFQDPSADIMTIMATSIIIVTIITCGKHCGLQTTLSDTES